VKKLTDQISSFELQAIDSVFRGIEPGSHLDVHLGENVIRQYSIYNCSSDNKTCCIAVKREDNGRGGSLQVHQLDVGEQLTVSQPRNHFQLEPGLEQYVLIAGGIGVTPIFSMANKLQQTNSRFDVYYLVHTSVDAAFADLFKGLELGDNFHLHASDESGLMDFTPIFANLPKQAVIYTCGPEPMMQAVEQAAEIKDIKVSLERFSAAPTDNNQENNSFQIEISSTGAVYSVGENDSILDILLQQDISVDYGCTEGICGACITDVLAGEIEHHDTIMTAQEQAANNSLCVCVSRSTSSRLVLDL
jgi:vanillate O-demethylase ferredoxin subunit